MRVASLDDNDLDADVVERLRNPPAEPLVLDHDHALRTGIELYLDLETASDETYTKVCATFHRALDRLHVAYDPLPSLYQVKQKVAEITGVYSITKDMCRNTCLAYTGPFSDLEVCPKCDEPRYDPRVLASTNGKTKNPQQQFTTIPLGPQLQALWRSQDGATAMRYRQSETQRILDKLAENTGSIDAWQDIYHGHEYLHAVQTERIQKGDTVLMMSLDGAQLYESKQSDCWIFIWVVLDLAPDRRYKKRHIIPAGFIPGPNKPKNVDSFLFPGFCHVAALMREGLNIWDAADNVVFESKPFVHLGTADGPGMQYLNGLTGHSGAYGCRLYCPVKGRRKGNHYYPALLKPISYDVAGSDHADINGTHLPIGQSTEYQKGLNIVLASRNPTQHQNNRRDTGITKPSLFSGFPNERTHTLPNCFGSDLMHLISLNIPDLLLGLWRGTIECDPTDSKQTWDWMVLVGDIWKIHGQHVADATPYLPGSFDRPPRNPAEKISSGYKAWEFLHYIFSLGPGLLYEVLPDRYWRNYCKLVAGVRLLHQRTITKIQLLQGHTLLVTFVTEFEEIYYQRKKSRLHFCRQSLHALLHVGPEIPRLGPGINYSQWPMERTIGNLGEEIRQPSNPFQNLSQRGVRRARVNSLIAMMPELAPKSKSPRISIDLGDNFILLGARDIPRQVPETEANAIQNYYLSKRLPISVDTQIWVAKWARLQLPNQQIVRTGWKEKPKEIRKLRISRNIMVYFC
jgi:hypothetical protein